MKRIGLKMVATLLVLAVISCNSKSKSPESIEVEKTVASEQKQPNDDLLVCDLLTEKYIKTIFPDATNFKQTSMEKPYPSCSYRFVTNNTNHKFGITMVKKYASEKNFSKSMGYIKSEKIPLEGIGKIAYYIPSMGQVSLFNGDYIIHIYATKAEKGNKEMAIKITNDILEKL